MWCLWDPDALQQGVEFYHLIPVSGHMLYWKTCKYIFILKLWIFFPFFLKCPFHGKIIPRDECGVPTNAEDRAREEKMRFEKQANQPGLWSIASGKNIKRLGRGEDKLWEYACVFYKCLYREYKIFTISIIYLHFTSDYFIYSVYNWTTISEQLDKWGAMYGWKADPFIAEDTS